MKHLWYEYSIPVPSILVEKVFSFKFFSASASINSLVGVRNLSSSAEILHWAHDVFPQSIQSTAFCD